MKIYLSYRFRGEDPKDLNLILPPIIEKLKESGHEVYCNLFDQELMARSKNFNMADFIFEAFKVIEKVELIFAFINSENKSEGMLMEVGYGIAKKIPLVVVVNKNVSTTYLPEMANLVIIWEDMEDLLSKIGETDFSKIRKTDSI